MDSKNVLECIETRRSVRKYLPDQIPDDVLQRIVRAGTFAATGINTQSPIMIVIRNKEMRDDGKKGDFVTRYCYSEEERLKAIQELAPDPEITRFKGLGEISPEEFAGFIGPDIRLE